MSTLHRVAGLAAALAVSALGLATTAGAAQAATAHGTVRPATAFANDKTAFEFFVAKGLSKKQAAGIVGNLDQESGVNPDSGKGSSHVGVAQWGNPGRWDRSGNDSEVHYTNVVLGVSRYQLNGQLNFIWYELTHYGYGYANLKKANYVNDATIAFQNGFEICGTATACSQSKRISYADSVYNAYK